MNIHLHFKLKLLNIILINTFLFTSPIQFKYSIIESKEKTDFLYIQFPSGSSYNVRTVNSCIGDGNFIFNMILDTGSRITWFKSEAETSSTKENLHKQENLNYGSGSILVKYYNDKFTLKSEKDISFQMSVGIEVNSNFKFKPDGIIGLSYGFTNKEYDFIESLLSNNIIFNDYISILDSKSNKSGVFMIGEKPELFNKKKQEGLEIPYCKLYPYDYNGNDSIFYNCILNGISNSQGREKITILNDNIIIDSGSTYNYISSKMYKFIIDKYINEYLQSNTCFYKDGDILCNNPESLNFGKIFFIFGQYSIGIEFFKLFDENNKLTFVESHSFLILGSYFLDEVTVSFSRKEKRIELINEFTVKMKNDFEGIYGIIIGLIFNIILVIILISIKLTGNIHYEKRFHIIEENNIN